MLTITGHAVLDGIGPFTGEREYYFRFIDAPLFIRGYLRTDAPASFNFKEKTHYLITCEEIERNESADIENNGDLQGLITGIERLES